MAREAGAQSATQPPQSAGVVTMGRPHVLDPLAAAEETLRAIRNGEVDALVVGDGASPTQVFTLASADRPYRMFVENMRDGAATVSESGIVLYANRRLAELLAVPCTDIMGSADHVVHRRTVDRAALRAIGGRAGAEARSKSICSAAGGKTIPVRVSTLERSR